VMHPDQALGVIRSAALLRNSDDVRPIRRSQSGFLALRSPPTILHLSAVSLGDRLPAT